MTKRRKESLSQAEQLVDLVAQYLVFQDDRGEAYGCLRDDDVKRTLKILGKDYRRWLVGKYYDVTGKIPTPQAIAAALSIIEATAFQSGQIISLNNRFARDGESIWLDLADSRWRAVEITRKGWRVKEAPILFRRYAHQAALPEPDLNGDVRKLFSFLKLRSPDDELLLLGWMVAALVPGIPRPILCFYGPQGSAKTTFAKMIRAVIDPSKIQSVNLPRNDKEMALVLDHHGMPVFDNITYIKPWQADFLCSTVSGAGFTARQLYTDSEDVVMSFQRAAIVTGICIPTSAPDLLERFLLMGLQRVPPQTRVEETELWMKFTACRPQILGGLLNILSKAMAEYSRIKLPTLPRMADFARWGAAAAVALGFKAYDFLRILADNSELQTAEFIDSDPLATAIVAFMREREEWGGSATTLMRDLTKCLGEDFPSTSWPKSANHVARRLRLLQAILEDVGLKISFYKSSVRGIDGKIDESSERSAYRDTKSKTRYGRQVSRLMTQIERLWQNQSSPWNIY